MSNFQRATLSDLWRDVPPPADTFDPASIVDLPEPVQRYLLRAIAPGTPRASAVRLKMHGHIRLDGRWLPLDAEQVIRWDRGFIWKARAMRGPMSIRGSDRFIDGSGAMQWKLLGLLPVMHGDGPDITRSAAGRLFIESIWLPSVLLGPGVRWRAEDETHVHATIASMGHEGEVTLTIDDRGRLLSAAMRRWGNPEGGEFRAARFGAVAEDERTFEGHTIATQLRVGWYFGTERFEPEGEFWRANITSATYR